MPSTKMAKGTAARRPSDEMIRKRAYELYLERGAVPGRELEDWEKASRELVPAPRKRTKV